MIKTKLRTKEKNLLLISCISFFSIFAFQNCSNQQFELSSQSTQKSVEVATTTNKETPASVMKDLKQAGCLAVGLFDVSTEDKPTYFDFIKRSQCKALLRTVDTWLGPTNFNLVSPEVINFKKSLADKKIHLGAFIAEVVYTSGYAYKNLNGDTLNVMDMCARDSHGQINQAYGPQTCVPDLSSLVFQDYVTAEISQLMDLGFQDFQFGQTQLIDRLGTAPAFLKKLRSLAESKNLAVVFGAQTNDQIDEAYLRSWDYISGGVGLLQNGSLENTDCGTLLSASNTPGTNLCWAILWRDTFRLKANNVIVTFDWFNDERDEVHLFSKLSASERSQTLSQVYNQMKLLNVGYAFTIRAPLGLKQDSSGNYDGCFGYNHYLISMINYPSRVHCNNEDDINLLMSK